MTAAGSQTLYMLYRELFTYFNPKSELEKQVLVYNGWLDWSSPVQLQFKENPISIQSKQNPSRIQSEYNISPIQLQSKENPISIQSEVDAMFWLGRGQNTPIWLITLSFIFVLMPSTFPLFSKPKKWLLYGLEKFLPAVPWMLCLALPGSLLTMFVQYVFRALY